jgi:hypothetical protein
LIFGITGVWIFFTAGFALWCYSVLPLWADSIRLYACGKFLKFFMHRLKSIWLPIINSQAIVCCDVLLLRLVPLSDLSGKQKLFSHFMLLFHY